MTAQRKIFTSVLLVKIGDVDAKKSYLSQF